MQVIAGALRGRKLKTPSGEAVRPTSGMVRGAMFNILGERIHGVRVLDLYSGTGAIAIEALSRGASSAVLVEKSPDSQKLILDNLRALTLSDRAQLIRGDVLSKLGMLTGPFEVVIADPPYRSLNWEELLQGLQQPGLLTPGAIVLFEHAKDEELPDTVGTLRRERVYLYGETQLSLFVWDDMTQQSSPTATPQWVERSDQFANAYIQLMARLDPEQMGQLGFLESDEHIIDLTPGFRERKLEALKIFIQTCLQDLQNESDPHVQQDLEILLRHARNAIREIELRYRYELPYLSVGMFVFSGLGLLLDERNDAKRRQAALVRLQRYTGLEAGYQPLTHLVMQDITLVLNSERIAPMLRELENDLGNTNRYVEGIRQLFERFQVSGFEPALAALEKQLTEFDAFIQKELLPRARQDHRLPAELYAFLLENNGVDLPPADLAREARNAFQEIQAQMQVLAREVAASQGLNDPDYRAVLKELKKDQVPGDAVISLYKQRLVEIETLLKENRLVTVPARAASIRLATEAESARVPSPYLDIPRLIGNQGEQGVFVIPTRVPASPGEEALQFDDFSFAAASWPLTAHEARPGHELQFATMIEQGVSLARAIFSFNSTNCEGWALYCEYLMRPYMPLDAQLVTLQLNLMRAARAFLDPEIQLGLMTREEAFRLLKDEVCLSDAMAHQEVDRYTFRMPGQATTYFYGFTRMLQLRAEVEAHQVSLDLCAFHDFILAQGLVPPDLLRQAVRTQYGLPSLAS